MGRVVGISNGMFISMLSEGLQMMEFLLDRVVLKLQVTTFLSGILRLISSFLGALLHLERTCHTQPFDLKYTTNDG